MKKIIYLKYFIELREYFPIQVFGSCIPLNESLPSLNTYKLAKKLILSEKFNDKIFLSTDCNRWSSCEKEQLKLKLFFGIRWWPSRSTRSWRSASRTWRNARRK